MRLIVPAQLEPEGVSRPGWCPWQLWRHDGRLRVHDTATSATYEAVLPHGPAVSRLHFARLADDAQWWAVHLGPGRLAAVLPWLHETCGTLPKVGAVCGSTDRWALAVNHPTDEGPCRLVLGRGGEIESTMTLPLTVARSISGLAVDPVGNVVFVDNYLHVCRTLDRTGEVLWSFGRPGEPGRGDDRLASPSGCALVGGDVLVVNEMSASVTVLDSAGRVRRTLRSDSEAGLQVPRAPTSVVALDHERALVSDAHAGRIYLLRAHRARWVSSEVATNRTPSATGDLSFPRGITADGDRIFVADTGNHRVVAVSISHNEQLAQKHVGGWPRALTRADRGLLVAEGLGRRVVHVPLCPDPASPGPDMFGAGAVDSVALRDRHGAAVTLADPHHIECAGAGRYWLVDSDLDDIVLFDRTGLVVRRWTESPVGERYPLADPHQAVQLSAGGDLLVVDTNNGRILRADRELRTGDVLVAGLRRPRFVAALSDGWLVSDHSSRLTRFDRDWEPVGTFVLRIRGAERHLHLDDPPRCLLGYGGHVYVPDWQRGLIYQLSDGRPVDHA